ncbi:MAG: hypothetical protein WBG95_05195 [Sulfitobacter sp.]
MTRIGSDNFLSADVLAEFRQQQRDERRSDTFAHEARSAHKRGSSAAAPSTSRRSASDDMDQLSRTFAPAVNAVGEVENVGSGRRRRVEVTRTRDETPRTRDEVPRTRNEAPRVRNESDQISDAADIEQDASGGTQARRTAPRPFPGIDLARVAATLIDQSAVTNAVSDRTPSLQDRAASEPSAPITSASRPRDGAAEPSAELSAPTSNTAASEDAAPNGPRQGGPQPTSSGSQPAEASADQGLVSTSTTVSPNPGDINSKEKIMGVAPPQLAGEADSSLGASEANQEALEGRFLDLYVALMEKQVSFKETVEPFKTDNQLAGKG